MPRFGDPDRSMPVRTARAWRPNRHRHGRATQPGRRPMKSPRFYHARAARQIGSVSAPRALQRRQCRKRVRALFGDSGSRRPAAAGCGHRPRGAAPAAGPAAARPRPARADRARECSASTSSSLSASSCRRRRFAVHEAEAARHVQRHGHRLQAALALEVQRGPRAAGAARSAAPRRAPARRSPRTCQATTSGSAGRASACAVSASRAQLPQRPLGRPARRPPWRRRSTSSREGSSCTRMSCAAQCTARAMGQSGA